MTHQSDIVSGIFYGICSDIIQIYVYIYIYLCIYGISCVIPHGILFSIPSDILAGIYSIIFRDIFSSMSFGSLSGFYSDILSATLIGVYLEYIF